MYADICQRIQPVSSVLLVSIFINKSTNDSFVLAYFNELAGEWGQIFHRGKGKRLEFVDHVEKIMINEDTEEIDGCSWIGVASIFQYWRTKGNDEVGG